MIQGTAEWYKARTGKVTASRVADVIAMTKAGPSERRRSYMLELIAERLSGDVADHFVSDAMAWGTDHEPIARAAYEGTTGELVDQVGFVDHPSLPMSGASPDGLVGTDGLVEIKCPATTTHIDYLIAQEVPSKYRPQIGWQLECTGRAWCDFVSFDPRLPGKYQLFIKRIHRDELDLDGMREKVAAFLEELAESVRKLEGGAA